jgi:hypothetical protein
MVETLYQNLTEIDKDTLQIDCRLLVSFCCETNVVLYLYTANYGKWGQKASPVS